MSGGVPSYGSVLWERFEVQYQSFHRLLFSQPAPSLEILRVNQLDAGVLDHELNQLLKVPIAAALTHSRPGLMDKYKPEIDAFLRLLMFRFSIFINKPTPGMTFLNLRFRNEHCFSSPSTAGLLEVEGDAPTPAQRGLYGLLTVGLDWAWDRGRQTAVARGWNESDHGSWRRRLWVLLSRAEAGCHVLELANLLLFLRHGRYRTVVERVLRLRLVYPNSKPLARNVEFEYMNRQIVWDGLTVRAIATRLLRCTRAAPAPRHCTC
jgi:peroxin-2